MAINPTPEQQHIRGLAEHGGSLSVKAFAGAGKTTTLSLIADAHPARRVIYLAFNKSIAMDAGAKMPSKVISKTTHSLAYAAMKPSRERLEQRLTGQYIAMRYGLNGCVLGNDKMILSSQVGALVLGTVAHFCNSRDHQLSREHVPSLSFLMDNVPQDVKDDKETWYQLRDRAANIAAQVWAEQSNKHSQMPITHDTYLKQWALHEPEINVDLIMLDEAQDTTPVILGVMENQHIPIVWVGDPHQQIYEWRGAIDAMDRVKVDHESALTQSFRFGDNIASQANILLRQLGETRCVIGAGNGRVHDGRQAFLTRTNATAISKFIELVTDKKTKKKRIEMVGANEMLTTLRQIESLQNGRPTGSFSLFRNYKEFVEHANSPNGRDMLALVNAINKHGIENLIIELNKAKQVTNGDITVSTIHRAKGREWDYVEIAGDFKTGENGPVINRKDENRLMYVGMTRARCELDQSKIQPWLDAMVHSQKETTPADELTKLTQPIIEVVSNDNSVNQTRVEPIKAAPAAVVPSPEALAPVIKDESPSIKLTPALTKRLNALSVEMQVPERKLMEMVLNAGIKFFEVRLKHQTLKQQDK